MWLNEYEIDDALALFHHHGLTVAAKAAAVVSRLRVWTNENSDGWPYWRKPSAAANKLMTSIDTVKRNYYRSDNGVAGLRDMPSEEYLRGLTPIKAFLTRQGVDPSVKRWILEGEH